MSVLTKERQLKMPDGSNLALQLTDLSDEIAMIIRDAVFPLRERSTALEARVEALEARVAEIPPPQPGPPGESVALGDVVASLLPQLEERLEPKLTAKIKHGADGLNGVHLADALIADQNLILTLSNGEIRKLGKVVGSDGKDASIDEVISILDDRTKRLKSDFDAALDARTATFATAADNLRDDLAMVQASLAGKADEGALTRIEDRFWADLAGMDDKVIASINELTATVDNLRAEFASVRASIEDKAGSAELMHIEERAGELTQAIARVTAEISDVREGVAQKADSLRIEQVLEAFTTTEAAIESKANQAEIARIRWIADLEQRDERRDERIRVKIDSVLAKLADGLGQKAEIETVESLRADVQAMRAEIDTELATRAVDFSASLSGVFAEVELLRERVEESAPLKAVQEIGCHIRTELDIRDETIRGSAGDVARSIAELEAKVWELAGGLALKADASGHTELAEAMRDIKNQVIELAGIVDRKAEADVVEGRILAAVADMNMQISHLGDGLATRADAFAYLELSEATRDIKGQVLELAEIVGRKVDADQIGERVLEVVSEVVPAAVANAVEALPKPADGHTPTAEELEPLIATKVLAAVRAHAEANPPPPPPPPPISVVDQLIDQGGDLHSVYSDASIKRVGRVQGRDGQNVDMPAVIEVVRTTLASWPRPRDGVDGLGFDDFTAEYDGERTVTLVFRKDDRERKFPIVFPFPLYRGIYRQENAYTRGDTVTFGGGLFCAEYDHPINKPEEEKSGWKLVTKKGRDGQPGKPADESRLKTVETSMLALQRRIDPIERRFAMLPM